MAPEPPPPPAAPAPAATGAEPLAFKVVPLALSIELVAWPAPSAPRAVVPDASWGGVEELFVLLAFPAESTGLVEDEESPVVVVEVPVDAA